MTSFELTPLLASARNLAGVGAWREVVALLEPPALEGALEAELTLLYGEALIRLGRERDALLQLAALGEALEGGPEQGTYRRVLNTIGAARWSLGELDAAVTVYGSAVELSSTANDLVVFAKATNNLGAIANVRGQHEEALWNYRLALPTLQRLGQPLRLAEVYHNMAHSFRDLGQLEQADEHELRAIEFATDAAAPRVAAMAQVGRAEVAYQRGDARLAETTASLAAAEFERLGEPFNEADAHRVVAVARAALGRISDALDAFARALEIARTHGHALNEAEALRDRARLWLGQGEQERATDDGEAAIALFDRLGATSESAELRRRIG